MLETVSGLDHVVIAVRDLAAAARTWDALGFTLSPPGRHSPHLGTANHTLVFETDYLELLGVVAETPVNLPVREFLARGEGVERLALATPDAERLTASLRAHGLSPMGPLDFGRPVARPDGSHLDARFRTVHWPPEIRPAGVRIFACQQLTREAVWLPELQSHPNGAVGIERVEIVSASPEAAAAEFAAMSGAVARAGERGSEVTWNGGGARLLFLTPQAFATLRPNAGSPTSGVAGLTLRTRDLAAARRFACQSGPDGAAFALPSIATGVALALIAAGGGTAD